MQDNIPGKLILKHLAGEASKEEEERLQYWLAQDRSHHDVLAAYRKAYRKEYTPIAKFNVEKGMDRLNQKIEAHENKVRRLTVSRSAWAIAAALVILAVAYVGLYISPYKPTLKQANVEKSNPYGQKSTFKLSDGSKVKLNSGSTLLFPGEFTGDERRVILNGEAFFEVVKDPSRPFIVETPGISTTVLGTSFNVRAFEEDENAVVSVVTGKVRVANEAGQNVELEPAQEAIYNTKKKELAKQPSRLDRAIAWKENILWFEKSTLKQVAEALTKWYGITVAFENAAIKECRLTGSFKNESLTNVLKSIKISTGINYEQNDNHVVFSGSACK